MDKKRNTNRVQKTKSKSNLLFFNRYNSLFFGIIFLVLIGTAAYWVYIRTYSHMDKLSRELVNLRSAMNIDSVRQYKLQKIMRIAELHNKNLTSSEVYDVANEIYEMSVKYSNLDVDLICAIITHESANTWNPKIVSPAGAMGLMQLMPVTGLLMAAYENLNWTTPEEVLFNPVYNIRMGARLLSILITEYQLDGALAAYNGGERQAAIWLANNKNDQYLWQETRKYIPAVYKLYNNYLEEKL